MDKPQFPTGTFLRNLNLFSARTQELVDEIFSLALQVLFLKYKRRKEEYEVTLKIRKRKGKKIKRISSPYLLKERDIANAIRLVDHYFKTLEEFDVIRRKDLSRLFSELPLADAERFYDEFLKKKDIRDIMGRKVLFDDEGKLFLYKEHDTEGKHVRAPENYVEARGKRLSWIEPLLTSTKQIYRQTEKYWETYLYAGVFNIVVDPNTAYEKVVKNYFLVVTRKQMGRGLRFVTAYFMNSQLELFKRLENSTPVSVEQQEYLRLIEQNREKLSKGENI